jgi:DNA-binding GntR family transcriptional regulator
MAMVRKPPTAQEAVLSALREAITTGALLPGQQIVQEELSASFGVSRVPLREALKILEGEGQVTYYPHRGYFVTELSVDDLREVYRLREILETEALTLAFEDLSPEDVAYIEELLDAVEASVAEGDVGAVTATNRAFHFAIFDLAGRPRLSRLIRQLWDATDVYRTVYFRDQDNLERIAHEHRAMIKALHNRNPDELIRIQDTHRLNSVAAVQSVLTESATKL